MVFLLHIKFFKTFFKLKIFSDYAASIGFQLIDLHDLLCSAFKVVETTVMWQNTWLDQGDFKKPVTSLFQASQNGGFFLGVGEEINLETLYCLS